MEEVSGIDSAPRGGVTILAGQRRDIVDGSLTVDAGAEQIERHTAIIRSGEGRTADDAARGAADHVNGLGELADRQRVLRFAEAPVVAVGQMRVPFPVGVKQA